MMISRLRSPESWKVNRSAPKAMPASTGVPSRYLPPIPPSQQEFEPQVSDEESHSGKAETHRQAIPNRKANPKYLPPPLGTSSSEDAPASVEVASPFLKGTDEEHENMSDATSVPQNLGCTHASMPRPGVRYRIRQASSHHGQSAGWYLDAQRLQATDCRSHESTYVILHRPHDGEHGWAGVWSVDPSPGTPNAYRLKLHRGHFGQEPGWYLDAHRGHDSDRRDRDSTFVVVHRLDPPDPEASSLIGCAGDWAIEPGTTPDSFRIRILKGHFGQSSGWLLDAHRRLQTDIRDRDSTFVSVHDPHSADWDHGGDWVFESIEEMEGKEEHWHEQLDVPVQSPNEACEGSQEVAVPPVSKVPISSGADSAETALVDLDASDLSLQPATPIKALGVPQLGKFGDEHDADAAALYEARPAEVKRPHFLDLPGMPLPSVERKEIQDALTPERVLGQKFVESPHGENQSRSSASELEVLLQHLRIEMRRDIAALLGEEREHLHCTLVSLREHVINKVEASFEKMLQSNRHADKIPSFFREFPAVSPSFPPSDYFGSPAVGVEKPYSPNPMASRVVRVKEEMNKSKDVAAAAAKWLQRSPVSGARAGVVRSTDVATRRAKNSTGERHGAPVSDASEDAGTAAPPLAAVPAAILNFDEEKATEFATTEAGANKVASDNAQNVVATDAGTNPVASDTAPKVVAIEAGSHQAASDKAHEVAAADAGSHQVASREEAAIGGSGLEAMLQKPDTSLASPDGTVQLQHRSQYPPDEEVSTIGEERTRGWMDTQLRGNMVTKVPVATHGAPPFSGSFTSSVSTNSAEGIGASAGATQQQEEFKMFGVHPFWKGVHAYWKGDLVIRQDGTFERVATDGGSGKWSVENNTLTLSWDGCEPEVLFAERGCKEFGNDDGFELTCSSPPDWFIELFEDLEPKWRQDLAAFVQSRTFVRTSTIAIVLNAVFILIRTDLAARHVLESSSNPLDDNVAFVAEAIFCLIFVLEFAACITVDFGQNECSLAQRAWRTLDAFFMVASVLEVVAGVTSNLMLSSTMHKLSPARVLRLGRRWQASPALCNIFRALANSGQPFLQVLLVFVMLLYVVGATIMIGMVAFVDHGDPVDLGNSTSIDDLSLQWGNAPKTVLTLLASVYGGESWMSLIKQLDVLGGVYLLWFFLYVVFASFLLFNLLLGLVVTVTASSMQMTQQDAITAALSGCDDSALLDHLVGALAESAGKDSGDSVSRRELQQLVLDASVGSKLCAVGLDVGSLIKVFDLVSQKDNGGGVYGGGTAPEVQLNALVEESLRLSGAAKRIDIAVLEACKITPECSN